MSPLYKLFTLLVPLLLIGCSAQIVPPLNGEQIAMREQKVTLLISKAVNLMRRGDAASFDEAFDALELARDLLPTDPRIVDGLGCVEWRRGNHKLAEHFFKKALEFDPYYDRAYSHLAIVAHENGDKQAALDLLQIAVKMNPLNHRSRNNYAVELLEEGNTYDAFHQLQRASLAVDEDDPVLSHNLKLAK